MVSIVTAGRCGPKAVSALAGRATTLGLRRCRTMTTDARASAYFSGRSAKGLDGPRIAVLLAAVLQVLTPLLPQFGIGEPIGSRSDSVRTLITPAGWAFSIWGALYAGSALFAIYQALPSQRDKPLLDRVRLPAAGAFL